MRFVATAARGVEAALAEELRGLGLGGVDERRGAVAFEGPLADGYRAVMWSRIASRVLLVLSEVDAPDAGALYDGVRCVDWTDHVPPGRTIAVDVARTGPTADNPRYLVLRTKDAVVDRIRETRGSRPDVDTRRPDVRVHVHLVRGRATVSVDLAGEALHRRGGRAGSEAPLKENLAAALLRIAGWPLPVPFVDPMCGSGTLCIEAARIALDVAPGLARGRHGLEGWGGHDAAVWAALRAEALGRRDAARAREVAIHGWDASGPALAAARENVERAGLGGRIALARVSLADARPPDSAATEPRGLVVTNPPYGARLGEAGELGLLYEQLGDVLRRRFTGWTAWVLSGNRALDGRIGLKPRRRHVVFNGPIECRFLELPISEVPVEGGGPAWRKPSPEAEMLANRLRKNVRRLRKWARREDVSCYRVYDADVPEYNMAIDRYDGAAVLQEYERPRSVDAAVAERHLRDAVQVVPEVLGIDPADVVVRVRRRRREGEQYERLAGEAVFREVREGGLRFLVNLTDYLDTGLFLDHRRVRSRIRDLARGRDFLNLFAYTCTATVYAAAGGARSTTSVDLSNTYLDWGRENLALNGLDAGRHDLVRADCVEWLARARGRYGLVLCAPPTHSRSKAMRGDFDLERDHVSLVRACARLLTPDGLLLFSPPIPRFPLDQRALSDLHLHIEDITPLTHPPDFRTPPHTTFQLSP